MATARRQSIREGLLRHLVPPIADLAYSYLSFDLIVFVDTNRFPNPEIIVYDPVTNTRIKYPSWGRWCGRWGTLPDGETLFETSEEYLTKVHRIDIHHLIGAWNRRKGPYPVIPVHSDWNPPGQCRRLGYDPNTVTEAPFTLDTKVGDHVFRCEYDFTKGRNMQRVSCADSNTGEQSTFNDKCSTASVFRPVVWDGWLWYTVVQKDNKWYVKCVSLDRTSSFGDRICLVRTPSKRAPRSIMALNDQLYALIPAGNTQVQHLNLYMYMGVERWSYVRSFNGDRNPSICNISIGSV